MSKSEDTNWSEGLIVEDQELFEHIGRDDYSRVRPVVEPGAELDLDDGAQHCRGTAIV